MNSIRTLLYTVIYGDWYWGWAAYDGKPKFSAHYLYYNGDHIVHIGKLYFGVSY